MSKANVAVTMEIGVMVRIDSDGILTPRGREDAQKGENEPFDRKSIEQWLRDEFSLSVRHYETNDTHGYMRVYVDHQEVEDVCVEEFTP